MSKPSLPIIDGKRQCSKCDGIFPVIEFNYCGTKPKGIKAQCRRCENAQNKLYRIANRERIAKNAAEIYKARKGVDDRALNEKRLIRWYGIKWADYEKMAQLQNWVCAICGSPPSDKKRLSVDHCHATGKVRGLLCHNCNIAIGLLKDDPNRFIKASEYLLGEIGLK